jgi:hypothetical protein
VKAGAKVEGAKMETDAKAKADRAARDAAAKGHAVVGDATPVEGQGRCRDTRDGRRHRGRGRAEK